MCLKWTSVDSTCVISSPNPMFDHLLESSRWDDSNKWSYIGFNEEIDKIEIKIHTLSGTLCIHVSTVLMSDQEGHDIILKTKVQSDRVNGSE